ncbi:SRPBCC family protein [Sphingomonas sp. LB-2]|uniref:SRPBCC family protein n=1 Tax=Sphingomonas caeni TaxID=2984949 RepID=UPI0022310A40|nr:SRPBCC family protein [Sphingomonas caeni]MCW3848043.1 SRPBCC family protein [Sphingomonas caeni]
MQFDLVTDWTFDQPIERVWKLLHDPRGWPRWWPAVLRVEQVEHGDETGVGAVNHFEWQTALPYRLAFEMRVTRLEPMALIEGRAVGDLDGRGLWTLREAADATHVRYQWTVGLRKRWMRWLVPLLAPVFIWNHNRVMEQGRRGLERALAEA